MSIVYLGKATPASGGSGGGSGDAVWGSITGTLSDQTDLANALAEKQDTLTAGSGIDITNNVISASISYDDATINENASNKLQAIGAIDKNSGNALGFWHGTQAEYNVGGAVKDTYYAWDYNKGDAITLPSSANWHDIVYGGGTWLLVARSSQSALYSNNDGANWTSVTMPSRSGYVAAAFGNNTFVAVDRNGTIAYSTDNCATWTNANTYGMWWNVAFGNNTFVATALMGSPRVSYSKDNGQTWADASSITVPGGTQLRGVAYGDGTFVVTGSGDSNTNFAAYSDDDGDNWTAVTMPSAQKWESVAFGNGMFVAISQTNKAAYSTDKGRTWTEVTLPVTATWNAITFGDNKFVAVAIQADKPVIYSVDGIHWSQTSFNIPASRSVAFGNGIFITAPSNSTDSQAITLSNVYTLDETPTTASTVYDAPAETSTLTITAVGTGTITLSDTNTYTYNADGNAYSYYSVGESYPNYVCNIDSVGLKIGDNDIANLASYSAFTGATGSVAGAAGLVPAPAATDNDKYLKGDGTWATVSGGGLQNTATGSGSLTILGTPTSSDESINIGTSSLALGYNAIAIGSILGDNDPTSAYNDAVAIGWSAIAYNNSIAIGELANARASTSSVVIGGEVLNGQYADNAEAGDYAVSVGAASKSDDYSVAVGANSYAMYNYSIALGYGAAASQDYEFVVGGYDTQNSQTQTFTLMDLSTGKIPNDRINGVSGSFTSQDGKTVTVTNGVITSIV